MQCRFQFLDCGDKWNIIHYVANLNFWTEIDKFGHSACYFLAHIRALETKPTCVVSLQGNFSNWLTLPKARTN